MHVLYLVTCVVTIFLNVVPFAVALLAGRDYMVSIHVKGQYSCAGSLVSEHLVITAAQTLIGVEERYIRIHGYSPFAYIGGCWRQVTKVHRHPEFDNDRLANDICLIKFEGYIEDYQHTDRIVLPKQGMAVNENMPGKERGFKRGGDMLLERYMLKVVKNDRCDSRITEKQFCAEYTNNTNYVDVGGPVLHNHTMIGITSYRLPGTKLGIYTKVSKYINDFIHKIFKEENVTFIG